MSAINESVIGVIVNQPAEIPVSVIIALSGSTPDPLHVHQVYLDRNFRLTGTPTGAIFEYFDGVNWHTAASYP